MSKHLYIITGTSRGLGAALAELLVSPDHQLLCLSRRSNGSLAERARLQAVECEQWSQDLADAPKAAVRLALWLEQQAGSHFASATLINNAALLAPPGPISSNSNEQLAAALRVGLEAPVLLTAAFLRATRHWPAARRVLNISSGLGRRAMAGAASYCAVKAGLDHFSRALALDEARQTNGARIVSLAPGVIDTDMQVQLRGADPGVFSEQSTFQQLRDSGQLSSSANTATGVLAYLQRADFGTQPVADVRDA